VIKGCGFDLFDIHGSAIDIGMTNIVQNSEIAQMVKAILEQFFEQPFVGWKQYYKQ
jgi:hypothetical protein